MPMFSVVIPTRNRPELLSRALESVTAQQGANFEIIVVNDGTSGEDAAKLDTIKLHQSSNVYFVNLPVEAGGHGCFKVMNTGAACASGEYLCFLDDDDVWLGNDHLADARSIIEAEREKIDVIFFNQAAFRGAEQVKGPIWIEDLGARLQSDNGHDAVKAFRVDVSQLLTAHGFSHTNATIIRKELFQSLGGFDTAIWYEGDRDFYLRCIDSAKQMRYLPKEGSRHNVPDPSQRGSLFTSTSDLRKAVDQIYLLHKAARDSHHCEIRAYARLHRKYSIRKAANAILSRPGLAWSLTALIPRIFRSKPNSEVVVAAHVSSSRTV